MKSCCNDGKYDASHHVEHIKQMASLQAQLRDHQRHLHYQVGDKLDDCLVMLADGHDQVMNAMIKELRDIVNSGYAREDMEPYHQEQDDHPLTRLARALQLSPSATTSLACMDKATLEELANKVVRQKTRADAAEAILALPWCLAHPELQKLKSQEKREEPQGVLPRCAHQCHSQGCSEQCIYDTYHSQGMQPDASTHKCSNLDCGRKCTQSIKETDPWLTKGAEIKRCQHSSDGPQSGSEPLEAPQVDLSVPSEATTGRRAPVHILVTNFLLPMISTLRRLHVMTKIAYITAMGRGSLAAISQATMQRLRELSIMVSGMRRSRSSHGPTSEDPDNSRSLEVPQAKATVAIHAIAGDGQQDITRLRNRFKPQPLRSKQAGLHITDTRCSECDSLVELGDVGYEDELCDNCVDEATERYWGPPHADRCTEDDASPGGPH